MLSSVLGKCRSVSAPTGSWSWNRPRHKTCPIHHPANSFTSSCTKVTYPITTHADCKSMNLIYQLQCTASNAAQIGETRCSLSDRMNGHCFTTTVSNPDLPVAIHTNPIRSLSKNAGLFVSYTPPWPHLTRTFHPITSHPQTQQLLTSPISTHAPAALTIFRQSFLFYCWKRPPC